MEHLSSVRLPCLRALALLRKKNIGSEVKSKSVLRIYASTPRSRRRASYRRMPARAESLPLPDGRARGSTTSPTPRPRRVRSSSYALRSGEHRPVAPRREAGSINDLPAPPRQRHLALQMGCNPRH
ncbi:hypothetical protein PVAP13_5NG107443 [Panicum virgatum]|uniref:Uncharacterized protein n=1 Tax=Panicum virgatum TaxID=38727 RepID=A0A8T0RQV4_PANVG|nr:hypothetical protein PVAP13_5NG107443 [Panicum virgatum]